MGDAIQTVQRLHQQGRLGDLPFYFARFLTGRAERPSEALALAAALVSQAAAEGHVCLQLGRLANAKIWLHGEQTAEPAPAMEPWLEALRHSGVVGRPGDYQPLILDGAHRLYLHRYWSYEQDLAKSLLQRAQRLVKDVDRPQLSSGLDVLFPASAEAEVDWQKLAAATAVMRCLTVISGGPGTGKTTTVTRILALLRQQPGGGSLRIALAAPTGKAAARMQEAIQGAKASLKVPDELLASIPEQASTLHRLLGFVPGSSGFRHHGENPLPLDVLILDEASMVDLALMAKLAQALPPDCRLILLGDKDQLASVEAGALLGDLCSGCRGPTAEFAAELQTVSGEIAEASGASTGAICDSVVILQRGFRFGSGSAIGRLASAVNLGDHQAASRLLGAEEGDGAVRWLSPETSLSRLAADKYAELFNGIEAGSQLDELFNSLNRFRVLCALKRGRLGATALNQRITDALEQRGLVPPAQEWYRGRPVMITQNDYQSGLYNGDVGLALPDPERGGELSVVFPAAAGEVRRFSPSRLPPHETVFAMTVHKSQGSEFDEVLLVLPERDLPLLSRELIYTAVTRARSRFALWAPTAVLDEALKRRMERHTGLADLLRTGSSFLTA
jgi:exodeoxyribonuclease V alpha subunit